jgi:hypothetical protein
MNTTTEQTWACCTSTIGAPCLHRTVEWFDAVGGSRWCLLVDGSTYVGAQRVSRMGYDQARAKHTGWDGLAVHSLEG